MCCCKRIFVIRELRYNSHVVNGGFRNFGVSDKVSRGAPNCPRFTSQLLRFNFKLSSFMIKVKVVTMLGYVLF